MNNPQDDIKIIAQNKKAYHEYVIEDKIETGIILAGSEVKSLRFSKASINESYAHSIGNEIFILGANIPEYNKAKSFKHSPTRQRKLLLHRKEIKKLIGLIKVLLGIAKGKKKHDKRQVIKERDSERDKARELKNS